MMKIEALVEQAYQEVMDQSLRPQDKAHVVTVCTRFLAAYTAQQEPACYIVQAETEDGFEYGYSASYPEAVHDHINETIQRLVDNGIKPYVMHCIPLYAAPVVPDDRIADLERQVAALTQNLENMPGANMLNANALRLNRDKLAASQLRGKKLREALETCRRNCARPEEIYRITKEALALSTDDTALQARLKEEREKCADLAKEATAYTQFQTVEHYKFAAFIEAAIRSMT